MASIRETMKSNPTPPRRQHVWNPWQQPTSGCVGDGWRMQTNTSIYFSGLLVNDQNAPIAETMKMETSLNNVCEQWIEPKKRRTCLAPTFWFLLSIENALMVGLQQIGLAEHAIHPNQNPNEIFQWWRSAKLDDALNWKAWKRVRQIRIANFRWGKHPLLQPACSCGNTLQNKTILNFATVWRWRSASGFAICRCNVLPLSMEFGILQRLARFFGCSTIRFGGKII